MIAAEGEHKASRALRHAAEVITGSPAALQVAYMTYIFAAQKSVPIPKAGCKSGKGSRITRSEANSANKFTPQSSMNILK